jgi:hypothetical protein
MIKKKNIYIAMDTINNQIEAVTKTKTDKILISYHNNNTNHRNFLRFFDKQKKAKRK